MTRSFNRSVNAFRISYLAPVTRNAGLAWRWWVSEIAKLLPENLRQIIATTNQRLVISAEHDDFVVHHGNAKQLREIGRQCSFLLSEEQILTRTITLPMAAEENLREVLSFEMDRQTPFSADQVYYDFVITERSSASNTLSLELLVAPRPVVDDAVARLAAAGIQVDVITTRGLDSNIEVPMNLLPKGARSNRNTILQRLNVSLATLAILLVISAITLPLIQKDQKIRSLEAEVQVATVAARASSQLRREVEELVSGSSYLVDKKQAEPTIVYLLDEMTGVIPDNTWVNRIDISNDEIQLQGQSGSAAGLIALIEASPTFGNAQFRSPVTQIVRTDQERFHLSADVLPGQDE